jgi:hypothetical protein
MTKKDSRWLDWAAVFAITVLAAVCVTMVLTVVVVYWYGMPA